MPPEMKPVLEIENMSDEKQLGNESGSVRLGQVDTREAGEIKHHVQAELTGAEY